MSSRVTGCFSITSSSTAVFSLVTEKIPCRFRILELFLQTLDGGFENMLLRNVRFACTQKRKREGIGIRTTENWFQKLRIFRRPKKKNPPRKKKWVIHGITLGCREIVGGGLRRDAIEKQLFIWVLLVGQVIMCESDLSYQLKPLISIPKFLARNFDQLKKKYNNKIK